MSTATMKKPNSDMSQPLMYETVWFDKYKYDDAERQYEELAAQERKGEAEKPKCKSSLVDEIARARQHIISSLQSGDSVKVEMCDQERSSVLTQFQKLESENKEMKKTIQDLLSEVAKLNIRMTALESKISVQPPCVGNTSAKVVKTEENSNAVNDDDDIDLFGSDDEDEAATKLREERLKAYETKKSKKAPLVAKSSVVLDVKPWDDETDMQEMEMKVREIKCDGLKWGAGKLVPLAFGIKKLQIVCVVEDDKVSIDWLQETIQEIEDLVQSVDIAAFNKL